MFTKLLYKAAQKIACFSSKLMFNRSDNAIGITIVNRLKQGLKLFARLLTGYSPW
jgi:hypothetical protein